jgi:hypothetical protein
MQMTKTVEKHFARLQMLARRKKNKGALPSYSWLNKNGFFYSYDVVRKAGLLKGFKRASRQ